MEPDNMWGVAFFSKIWGHVCKVCKLLVKTRMKRNSKGERDDKIKKHTYFTR